MKLKSLFFVALCSFLCIFAPFETVNAISSLEISYKKLVQLSDKVVLGKITSYEPVYDEEGEVTGWAAKVKVTQKFKGDNKDFTLYTRGFNAFRGYDQDYLIIASKNDEYDVKKEKATYTLKQNKDVKRKLDISEYEYVAWGRVQNVFFVDPFAREKFGGDWILELDRSNEISTMLMETLVYTKFVKEGENKDHPEFYIVYNLFDFLRENLYSDK